MTPVHARCVTAVGLVAVSIAPAVAAAAEGGEHGGPSPWFTLVWNVINFAILVTILVIAMKKLGLKGYLAERRLEIERSIEDADARKADAERRHQEYTDRLANIEQEIAALKQEFIDAAEQENARALEEAKEAAERIRHNAQFIADQEVKKGRLLLQQEAAMLAIEAAEKLVKEQLTDADRERLVNEFLDEVRTGAGGGS